MTWQSLKVVLVVAVIMLGFIAQVRAADYDLIEVSDAANYHYTSDRIQDQTLLAPRFFFLSIWNYRGADSASVTITAEKEIAKTNPQPDVLNPPTYRWSFPDIPIQSYRQVRVTMSESVPATLGFNAERTVSKDSFTHEDYQETTVTVTLTGKSSALGVNIHTPFNSTFLSASIVNSSSGAKLLQPSEGLPLRVSWHVENPSAGTTYTFRVTMELTPRGGAVKFVPSVLIFTSEERQTIAEGAETSAVSRVIGLGKVEVEFPKPCTWYMTYTRYPVYFWFDEAFEVPMPATTSTSISPSGSAITTVTETAPQTVTVRPLQQIDLTLIAIAIVAAAAVIGLAIVFAVRRRR